LSNNASTNKYRQAFATQWRLQAALAWIIKDDKEGEKSGTLRDESSINQSINLPVLQKWRNFAPRHDQTPFKIGRIFYNNTKVKVKITENWGKEILRDNYRAINVRKNSLIYDLISRAEDPSGKGSRI